MGNRLGKAVLLFESSKYITYSKQLNFLKKSLPMEEIQAEGI